MLVKASMYIYVFGDNYIRVIPVPMPNTEVKPYVPKILANFFAGKIGRRQIFLFNNRLPKLSIRRKLKLIL